MRKIAIVVSLLALCATSVSAGINHNFIIEGDFVKTLTLSERIESQYDGWTRPGFGIACSYIMLPIKYLGAGCRFSYARVKHPSYPQVTFNAPGMLLVVRPRYEFPTETAPAVFAQVSPGLYRIAGRDEAEDVLIKDTFFALEAGAGLAVKTVEFGANYHMAIDRKDSQTTSWLSVFAALRLGLPEIKR